MTPPRSRAWISLLMVCTVLFAPGPRNGSASAPDALPVVSEGVAVMGAGRWHRAGFRGDGVRVGIVDRGFSGYRERLGSELPTLVTVRNLVDGQQGTDVDTGTAQGTAVAEIVHDVAPGSALYLAKVLTPEDLAEAVDWLLAEGVRVINTSIGWYDASPGDGTGLLADAVNRAVAAGVVWVSAAGDSRLGHWSGDWHDAHGDNLLDMAPFQNQNWLRYSDGYAVPAGVRIEVALRWSDWANVDQDLDLYLYAYTGSEPGVVASSADLQDGTPGQQPVERLVWVTTGAAREYAVVVRAQHAPVPLHVDLFVLGGVRPLYGTPGQSLASPADTPGALGVSAVFPAAPYTPADTGGQGPTKGPGGVSAGGLEQPALAGYGPVATSTGTLDPTAAAAPHAAGAAALVLGRYPAWEPNDVIAFLCEKAGGPAGPEGWDPAYGHGRLYLGDEFANWLQTWFPLIRN